MTDQQDSPKPLDSQTVAAYLRLHPESPRLDYVLYLRGLSNFSIDQDSLLKRLPVNMAHRDMGQARIAFDDFRQLNARYPDSPYAADARQRRVFFTEATMVSTSSGLIVRRSITSASIPCSAAHSVSAALMVASARAVRRAARATAAVPG